MARLQPNDPRHVGLRNALRVAGPVVFLIGLILTAAGFISFIRAFGSFEPPRFFWLAFIGMPLMFIGAAMSMFGFMGAVARYQANEAAPVMTDTFNYAAHETRDGIKTVAGAIGEGFREGAQPPDVTCPRCQVSNDSDSRFCKSCGEELSASSTA